MEVQFNEHGAVIVRKALNGYTVEPERVRIDSAAHESIIKTSFVANSFNELIKILRTHYGESENESTEQ